MPNAPLESVPPSTRKATELLHRVRSVRIELDDLAREAEMTSRGPRPRPRSPGPAEADRDRIQRLFDKHRASTLDALANAAWLPWRNGSPPRKTATDSWPIGTRALPDFAKTLDDIGASIGCPPRSLGASDLCLALQEHLAHLKMAAARLHFEWALPELPKRPVPPAPR